MATVSFLLCMGLVGCTLGLSAQEAALFENDGSLGIYHGLSGWVNITDNGDTWKLESNGVPDHNTGDFPIAGSNPNEISTQTHEYDIPKNPSIASEPTCLSMGVIGIAKNGVAIFNPFTLEGCNAVEGSGAEEFDECNAHPAPNGAYHYHMVPNCIVDGTNDQFIGVALDGFPIYGPLNSAGQNLTSADLDECHGETVNGNYRYRVTHDYPYYLGCYKGGYVSSMGGPAMMRKKRQSGPPGGGEAQCSFANQATLEASSCYTTDGNGNNGNAGNILHTTFLFQVGLAIVSAVVTFPDIN
ncbi:unnamed protein product [Owenia fusiformis]|uniref:Uncharacterized protein n=1 Tax=Owenia fusiformis TaxID=6347 RepID=A0A8J1YBS1_OWEFU|nr:unnamed protein product [Owenia fusiformis]